MGTIWNVDGSTLMVIYQHQIEQYHKQCCTPLPPQISTRCTEPKKYKLNKKNRVQYDPGLGLRDKKQPSHTGKAITYLL
jgi:hypothetical protein